MQKNGIETKSNSRVWKISKNSIPIYIFQESWSNIDKT